MLTKLEGSFLEKILISISVQSFEPRGAGRKFKVICTLTLRPVFKGKFAIYKLKVNKINSLKYKVKLFGIKHHQGYNKIFKLQHSRPFQYNIKFMVKERKSEVCPT